MIAGIDCSEPSTDSSKAIIGKQCSYPARFSRWLAETYYGADASKLKFINRALGGTTTAGALPQLSQLISQGGVEIPDLVIVDYGVNDRFEEQDWLDHGTYRKDVSIGNSAGDKVFAATEALLRYVLKTHPTAAIAMADGFCENSNSFSKRAHKKATFILGVPYITYSRLTRHGCNQVACGGKACLHTPHPPFPVHEHVKVGLSHWWKAFAWRLKCRSSQEPSLSQSEASSFMLSEPPMAPDGLVQRYKVCERSLSTFDARSIHHGNINYGSVRGWPLTLDNGREDRAAWTASGEGSTITFDLHFGQSPQVALVFTKGYDNTFGEAEVTMFGSSAKYYLQGCCNHEKVTQGELVVMNVGQSPVNSKGRGPFAFGARGYGFGIQPYANATLQLKFIRSKSTKFSVSFISSC